MSANDKIKEIIKKIGKTQQEIANLMGISKRTLETKLYRGGFYADELIKIADYLDVSVDYLLGRTANQQSHKS